MLQNVKLKSELKSSSSIHIIILVSIKNDITDKDKILIFLETLMINMYNLHFLTGDFGFSIPQKLPSRYLPVSETERNGLSQARHSIWFSKGYLSHAPF